MEGGEDKDSKAAREEVESPEQPSEEPGAGRSFDCVFCKRGFSNAQALGGHMNIHRKERARMRPEVGKPHETPRHHLIASDSLKNFASCDGHGNRQRPRELSLFGQETSLGLSMQFDDGSVEVEREKRQHEEEGEVDLELRLGHEP